MNSSWADPDTCDQAFSLSQFPSFDTLFMTLQHEEKGTHKTCIINQAKECVCDCWRSVCGVFPLLNESAVSMHVPMHPSAPHWGNLIPLSQPDIHCHMHCREEARPLHVCVWSVCKPESVCVCVCVCGR